MHIGFRKDFSKKRRVLVEGAWGGVRERGNECKKLTCKHLRYAANNLHDLLSPPLSHSPIPKFANEQREQAIGRLILNLRLSLALYRMWFFVSSLSHIARYVPSPTNQTWRKANAIKPV